MKILVYVYLIGLMSAALIFAIFPAEDTYVNPVEVRPVETRVERVVSDPVNLSPQIEVNVKEVAALESRVSVIEAQGVATRVEIVERQASNATANADTARRTAAEMQAKMDRESQRRLVADLVLFGFVIVGGALLATALWLRGRKCKRTSGGHVTRT